MGKRESGEVRFDLVELHPESGRELDDHDSFDTESEALEALEDWDGEMSGHTGTAPWIQAFRVEGDCRIAVVAEINKP